MKDLQVNNIPSENQNARSYFEHGNKGLKILFVGNSITKHAPKPQVGWTNDCGMAASCLEKDYVHVTFNKIQEIQPDSSFAILQVADFERNFETMDIEKEYKKAVDYKPDIILMFFGANVRKTYAEETDRPMDFGVAYEKLRNLLNSHGTAKIFHCEGFYIRNLGLLDKEKRQVAEKYNDTFIELGDIRTREDTHGRFNHPSDKGMQELADLFFSHIKPYIK